MRISEAATLLRYLSPGDGVIDIGANDGAYARHFAAAVGLTGKVLAVEPDPVNVKKLRATVGALPHVEIVEAACWCACDEPVILHCDTGDRKRNSLWPANLLDLGSPIAAVGVTLDDLAAQVPRLRAIKIDTQGAEVDILRGGTKTLANQRLAWMVELWPQGLKNAGSWPSELADIFTFYGYHPHDKSWADALKGVDGWDGHRAVDLYLVHD